MSAATLQDAVDALSHLNCKPTKAGDGFIAYCPIHEADGKGHKPSLTLKAGDTVPVVVNCHAGCDGKEILKALGVNGASHKSASIVAVYRYQTADGIDVREKLRHDPKDFRIRHRDAAGNWTYKAGDGPPVLYRLPEVKAAIDQGCTVFVCEGERDCDRLASAGLVATTNIEGAAQPHQRPKWKTEYTAQLSGAARVVLIPDNDAPGKAHMKHVAAQLSGKVGEVRWLDLPGLPEKGDVSDWLNTGHTADELKALSDSAPEPPAAEPQRTEPGAAEGAALDLDPYRGTDEANAALFLSMHGADVRYCPSWGKWLLWTGGHWRIDDLMDVARRAGDMPSELYRKAADAADTAHRRTIAGLARSLESRRKQNDLLAAARCRVVVSHADLDKDRFLLNARNGTIDLSAGTLREHRRADLLTHDTEIVYRPDATAPTWERFIFEIFAGDTSLIRFVQRAVGYSLTGDVREQVLFVCHGGGSNGKSVFLNIVRKLLGKLALQAAPDLLMADRRHRHPTEQADLFGKRLVVCQETPEGRRLNETLVKTLTGCDAITARRMNEDFWTFEPLHKLWLATNHRPEIRGTDHAIWRRIRLIPFSVRFSDDDDGDHKKDPDMEAKLTRELPGILAWSVRGCLDWQREGLRAPEAVKAATANYQQEQDVLAAWLADCCVIRSGTDTKAADLYNNYVSWCARSGEHPEPQRRWGMRLTERGFQRQRRTSAHHWLNIELIS